MKLARRRLAEKTAKIGRLGTEIFKKADPSWALVFASIGPTGDLWKPFDTGIEMDLVKGFAEQYKALTARGADGIVIETMMDLSEAKTVLLAVKENASLSECIL